jgi:hypothetical protein
MMNDRLISALCVAVCLVLASGCASITRGTTEAYAVQTKPPGAEVRSSSGWRCETPCSVKVKRRSDFVLTITKPGYENVTATVTSSIDGAGAAGMAGNVILGGIIGAGIDAGTGAMHSHKPNPLVVEMVPLVSPAHGSRSVASSVNPRGRVSASGSPSRVYVPAATRSSYSTSHYSTSQTYRSPGRVYLDDYEGVPLQTGPPPRKPVILGQKKRPD